ncbi:hypothetical protein JOC78_000193 [Bacillus ectoiniformans]|uniref:hypothetical protein n=1 Tax=Bacillus ectoiniformans TaxID=1494429 RepID=UPI00195887BA|nr:hypothetical protein [Bacillus ectoiniformans]MBM7647272.1 hypothetical protein [Bacillus ectoiniformans]
MKQVMNGVKRQPESREKLAVLKMELDYELAVLFEAMESKNKNQMEKSKEKLNTLRSQLIHLNAM